jgi:dihydrolipoamide dehydrogenase
MHSDLIILGAGPGGYETALDAAGRGISVTLVNGDRLGGTCLNEGCIPTKCMVKDAGVVRLYRESGIFGASCENVKVDFDRIVARREEVVSQLRSGIDTLLQKAGVNVVNGLGSFKDDHTVVVNGEEFDADNIIIATGSRSKSLPVPGANEEWVLDSTKLLNIDHIPESLVIVGGGVIGLEFASVFSALGSEVTVVEFMKQILPPFDSDIAKRLKQALSKQGIKVLTGAGVTSLEKNAEGKIVTTYESKGKSESVISTDVLMAVGRGANVEGLNLEAAGVEYSRRGINVDDNMRTNVEHIYAIGDVNARMMLAHVATFQGKRALNAIQGISDEIRLDVVPSAVFVEPECGMVGMTEEQCKAAEMDVVIGKSFFRANGKALSAGESEGICKLIFCRDTMELVGAHIMGAEAALLSQQCADFITAHRTREQICQTIFGHPTLAEVILAAAESAK